MADFESTSELLAQGALALGALRRVAAYFRMQQEAPQDLPGDAAPPRVLVRLDRSELVGLELQGLGTPGSPLVVTSRWEGIPLLREASASRTLEYVGGRRMADLAPTCAALAGVAQAGGYHLVAVNGITRSARAMAEELCCPATRELWLDLRQGACMGGMRVQFQDLCAGYAGKLDVLRGLSVDVPPLGRAAFLGPPGSGKSTALLCLIRFLEPRRGRVLLDGRDAAGMGLKALRSLVGLVPQDPAVFQGSWRYNIDPLGEYPDGKVRDALSAVRLLPVLLAQRRDVDSPVAQDGTNLSLGQKQLLGIARMLLRQPPVLLLDECTSALDPATQDVVHATLKSELPSTTIVAASQHAQAVLGFDKVVLLQKGEVLEQGPAAISAAVAAAGGGEVEEGGAGEHLARLLAPGCGR